MPAEAEVLTGQGFRGQDDLACVPGEVFDQVLKRDDTGDLVALTFGNFPVEKILQS